MRRHFEHMHTFGETSSIMPHSPLSRRGVKSIFVGLPVQPPAQNSDISSHFQTLVGAGEQTALCVGTLETCTRAGKPPLSRHTLRLVGEASPQFHEFQSERNLKNVYEQPIGRITVEQIELEWIFF